MYETDDDRLMGLQLFGSKASAPNGECYGILDPSYLDTDGIDNATIALIVRTSDVVGLALAKGVVITFEGAQYAIRRRFDDLTGMSTLTLGTP
jgi:hypothetical protein